MKKSSIKTYQNRSMIWAFFQEKLGLMQEIDSFIQYFRSIAQADIVSTYYFSYLPMWAFPVLGNSVIRQALIILVNGTKVAPLPLFSLLWRMSLKSPNKHQHSWRFTPIFERRSHNLADQLISEKNARNKQRC